MPLAEPTQNIDILLYAVNGTGLGHLTRLMAIGRWLRKLINARNLGARVYFLSCSDADYLLAQQGFASFKIPSRAALRKASVAGPASIALIRRYAEAALNEIAPDILVVDTFPTGTFDELLPILGRADVTKVFVFREQRADYMDRIPYARLLSHYDLMLVPHPRGACRLPADLDPELKIRWSGNVIFGEPNELWTKARAQRALGIPRSKTVIYTAAGGGGDSDFTETLELIAEVASEVADSHLVIGAGPLNRSTPQTGPNRTWTTFYPISRMFKGFDFAISSSGYNTVHELLYFRLPAILYAQERRADDQLARARQVADSGAGISLDRLDRASLEEALTRLLDPEVRSRMKQNASKLVKSNGAKQAAMEILDAALPRLVASGRVATDPAVGAST